MIKSSILTAFFLLFFFSSCNSILDDEEVLEENKVNVKFTLSMNSAAYSRAITYEDGNYYENNIDLSEMHVFLFKNNACIGEVKNLVAIRDNNTYEIVGDIILDSSLVSAQSKYKIMVFANSNVNQNYIDNMASLVYSYDESFNPNIINARYIPMWGVSTTSELTLEKGKNTDLGEINILRSMAKIEISCSDVNYSLNSASLTNSYNKGYIVPEGYGDVVNTIRPETPYIPTGCSMVENIQFLNIGGKIIVYVPEYEKEVAIKVNVTNNQTNESKDYTLKFVDYSSTPPLQQMNIVRNWYYKFNITKISDKSIVSLNFMGLPWEGEINITVPEFN